MSIQRAAKIIEDATSIIITCGAGMGVDSGMPDFRGKTGFWRAFPLLKDRNLDLASMSTPAWFNSDPDFAWGFFGYRYNMYSQTTPHQSFQILRRWGESKRDGYFVYTSNVDGHFQKAGFDPDRIVECHGSINHLQCVDNCHKYIWDMPQGTVFDIDDHLHCSPPHLMGPPGTNSYPARPNILMFNDYTWIPDRTLKQYDRLDDYLESLKKDDCRVALIEIGSGLAVPTVRNKGEDLLSMMPRGTLIRINKTPEDCGVPKGHGHVSICKGGLEALQEIEECINNKKH